MKRRSSRTVAGWLLEQTRIPVILPSTPASTRPARPIFTRDAASERSARAPGEVSMSMRMLIDARHPEETRVAVAKGNRIEEFDFESSEHKQLKGNIYLAKVTRVEPSLQAAFVDYGGNRHGFLAFSEIHPDYYQIPREDREALLREEAEHAAEEERLRAQADEDFPLDSHHDDDGFDDRPEELGEDDHDHDGDHDHDEVDGDEPVQRVETTGGGGRRAAVDEADALRR